METSLTLYRLQRAELERADCARKLAQVKTGLQDNSQVDAAAAAAQGKHATLTKAQTGVRELELEAQSLKAKLKSTEERMFSGKVSNPKELTGLQGENESLKRRLAKLEDHLLEAMIQLEDAEAEHGRAAAILAATTSQRQAQVSDLTGEQAQLEQRISELETAISQTRASLAAEDMSLYEHMSRRKGGRPVALLIRGNVCGACGVVVPLAAAQQARDRQAVAFCPSCERVLHSEG